MVNCPNCGYGNIDGTRNCASCGDPLPVAGQIPQQIQRDLGALDYVLAAKQGAYDSLCRDMDEKRTLLDSLNSEYEEKLPEFEAALTERLNKIKEIDDLIKDKYERAEAEYQERLRVLREEAEKEIAQSRDVLRYTARIESLESGLREAQTSFSTMSINCGKRFLFVRDVDDFLLCVANILRSGGYCNVSQISDIVTKNIDLTAEKDGIIYSVRCEFSLKPVGKDAVRRALDGKSSCGAHVALVVSNNNFSSGAEELALDEGVLLWNGDKLSSLLPEVDLLSYLWEGKIAADKIDELLYRDVGEDCPEYLR